MRNRITFSAYAAAWTAGAAASTETAAAFFFALRFLTDLVEPAFEGTLLDVEAEAALALRLLALLDARDTLLLALDAPGHVTHTYVAIEPQLGCGELDLGDAVALRC